MFDFDGDHATLVRPPHKEAATPNNWAKDPSGPGANDGTRLTASLMNAIVGNLRHLLDAYNIRLPGSADDALKLAILAAINEAIQNHTHDISTLTDGGGYVRMTEAERAKLAALVTNYKGAFADLAAVKATYPTAEPGDWAIIMLPGEPGSVAVWDEDEEEWVDIDNAPPATASTLPFTPYDFVHVTNTQAALELIINALAKRLRVDAAQTFAPAETAQGRANLGLGTGPLSGWRNKLVNGDGRINQRVAEVIGDDTYGHDRHYALTESGSISVSTVFAPASGITAMMRLTQAHSTPQRMGYAQITEAIETFGLRGKTITLGGKLRCSISTPIRFAVLAWSGPANDVLSDVINDWASPNYVAGSFFITGVTVAAVGVVTPDPDAITDWAITATVGSLANNLILLYWTEAPVAPNVTLDMRWYLVEGDATREDDPFSQRSFQEEMAICQRYYEKSYNQDVAPGTPTEEGCAYSKTTASSAFHHLNRITFAVSKCKVPTITLYSIGTGAPGFIRNVTDNVDLPARITFQGCSGFGAFVNNVDISAEKTLAAHWTADAEL